MKQKDNDTLSLFGDEPPASDLQKDSTPRKKLPDIQTQQTVQTDQKDRAESPLNNPKEQTAAEVVVALPFQASAPKPRTNTPWAAALAALQSPKPRVMLVITKGEAGGAQSHVLSLCEALVGQVRFTVVIGGPDAPSWLGEHLKEIGRAHV